jgi:hypothetical protein
MMSPAITSDWSPAKKLKELLNARREKIGENPIIHAGIYLDPRFRSYSLNGMSQNSAKQVIRAIFFGNPAVIEPISPQAMAVGTAENLEALISAQFSSQQSYSTVQPLQQHDKLF